MIAARTDNEIDRGLAAQDFAALGLCNASCNDDAVREMLVSFVLRPRGINNPVLGEAHIRGKSCEIMVRTDTGKEVGYIHYSASGYKWAPVLRVDPLTDLPAK